MSKKWFGKTRVDAGDLAEILGEALDQAFERHLPSPQEIADSIAKAIENANFSTAEQMGKIKAAYVDNQNALTQKWDEVLAQLQATQQAMTDLPGAMQKVMSDLPNAMQQVFSGETEKWQGSVAAFGEQVDKVPETFAAVTEESRKQVGEMFQQLTRTFADQVSQIKTATEKLGDDLQKISEMTAGIDKILHVQETVDGLMKQITAADEMKTLFDAFQKNLVENNKFLQAAAQPRTVRLVESDAE